MKVQEDLETGQIVVWENDQKVLQYNYQMVSEKEVVRPDGENVEMVYSEMSSGPYYEEYLKSHPTYPSDTVLTSAIYSIPRSDYIHPLYGLDGEMLTNDWPDGGHPHHRGIFWAWPEVIYQGQWSDPYALQRLFTRPTGDVEFTDGTAYTEIKAENQWMWEDQFPIVQELVKIRVHRARAGSRVIDLRLEFLALEEEVSIATRFTDSYGGLNIRMQTPAEQEISYYTAEEGAESREAWADFNGYFEGNEAKSGLTILQHHSNPEYPGTWVEYPDLSWIQPTFPTPTTRYELRTTEPLVLNYRLIIHQGGRKEQQIYRTWWEEYQNDDELTEFLNMH